MRQRLLLPAGPQAEAAAARSHRPRRCSPAARRGRRRSGNRGRRHARPVRRSGIAGCRSGAAARRTIRRRCAAGCWSPCRPRCRRRRSPAGSGSAPAGRPARGPRRHRSCGNRPRPRRCPSSIACATGRQAALGVAHRRRVIAVDIAEIALAVDQRIALREILRQPDQRLIHRELAMRVEFADHVADDAGAFLVAGAGIEPQLVHRVQDAAMHRLQPVAHIGQRARHDRRQRIGQIALAERVGEIDVADLADQRRYRTYLPDLVSISRRIITRSRSGEPPHALDKPLARFRQPHRPAAPTDGAAGNARSGSARRRCRPDSAGASGRHRKPGSGSSLSLIGRAGLARHGAAGARRHIGEILVRAGHRAARQIEPEPERRQQVAFPRDIGSQPSRSIRSNSRRFSSAANEAWQVRHAAPARAAPRAAARPRR